MNFQIRTNNTLPRNAPKRSETRSSPCFHPSTRSLALLTPPIIPSNVIKQTHISTLPDTPDARTAHPEPETNISHSPAPKNSKTRPLTPRPPSLHQNDQTPLDCETHHGEPPVELREPRTNNSQKRVPVGPARVSALARQIQQKQTPPKRLDLPEAPRPGLEGGQNALDAQNSAERPLGLSVHAGNGFFARVPNGTLLKIQIPAETRPERRRMNRFDGSVENLPLFLKSGEPLVRPPDREGDVGAQLRRELSLQSEAGGGVLARGLRVLLG